MFKSYAKYFHTFYEEFEIYFLFARTSVDQYFTGCMIHVLNVKILTGTHLFIKKTRLINNSFKNS